MKTLIDPESHEYVLAQWHNASARIWIFHVSLKRMAIMLSRKDDTEALYIIAIGCEYLSGPFSWEDANISTIADPPNHWGEIRYHIVDKQADFDLRCSSVVVLRGPSAVPIDSFENFLEDAE